MATALHAAGRSLLDLAIPRVCVACGCLAGPAGSGAVCVTCWTRLRRLPEPQCTRCGHPRRAGHTCAWCAMLPPYVRAARSFCWVRDDHALRLVHALKYEGWRSVAEGMAQRIARLEWPWDVVQERTAVVPVPLAPVRQRERGFNQAALIADGLAGAWNVPSWPTCLERARFTTSQTRLTPEDRRGNVRGAFRAARGAAELRGAHVVLVDDVVTTCSTLNACAAALYDAGARIVSYVTFARAPAPGDRL